MKILSKPFLFCILLVISFFGCKKDTQAPAVAEIKASKEKIAVGQYLTLTPSVTDSDTDLGSLTYSWSGTDGFKSTAAKPDWIPASSGNQTITLTVSDGSKSSTKSVTIQVVEPDFRRALWGDGVTDVQLYKSKAGKTVLSSSSTVLSYAGADATVVDAYSLSSGVVVSGLNAYIRNYTSDFQQYVNDYNSILNTLRAKHGNYESSKIYFRTEEIKNQLTGRPDLWADAIVGGDARVETTWIVGNTEITHLLGKSTTSNSVVLGTFYTKKTTSAKTAATSSFNSSKAAKKTEELFMQISQK